MSASAALLALALLLGSDAETQREWTIRRWAFDVEASAGELADALASDEWTARYDALDALARAPLDEPLPPAQRAAAYDALADPHPNVRARAIAALRRHGAPLARGTAPARDPLPEVRAELARACATDTGDAEAAATGAVLLELSRDADPTVADAARRAVAARSGERDAWLKGRVLADAWAAGRDDDWLELVLLLARGGGPLALDVATPDHAESGSREHSDDESRNLSGTAALAALRVVRGDARPGDGEALVAGWLDPLAADDAGSAGLERRRRELLLRAARRAGADVGRGLLARLEAASGDPDRAGFLIEGALEALGADAVARAAQELALDSATEVELWRRATAHRTAWSREAAAPWLAARRAPAVREAAATVLAQDLVARGDPVAGGLLVPLLEDEQPGLRALAIDALTDALSSASADEGDRATWLAALHADWVRRPADEQQALLEKLPRDVPPAPFRADLLRIGDASADLARRSPSLIELCQLFPGDEELGEALERWLEHDLDELARHPPSDTGRGPRRQGAARELELRAQGLVRALQLVRGEDAVPAIQEALGELVELGDVEVAKVCVQVLGRSARGRRTLPFWFAEGNPHRVRIEAALLLDEGAPSAVRIQAQNYLIGRYPTCDGELRARVLRRMGELTDSNTLTWLAHVATSELPLEERGLALSSIAARRHPTLALAALAGVLDDVTELEVSRRAIEAVASVGGDGARELLLVLWSRWAEPGSEREPAGETRELLREELLLALARVGDVPRELEGEVAARPLASAEDDLRRRFEGRRGTATEFDYRAELELCARLALEGRLGAALADAPLHRLDARLDLALAERALAAARRTASVENGTDAVVEDSVAAARALLEAAEIGFAGEALDDEAATLRLAVRARLALLARAERRWEEAERRLAALVADWRGGWLDPRTVKDVLGRDAASIEAASALLESALERSRAWVALERGELARAREHAARARARAGRSESSWEEQRRLEARLAR